MKLIATSFNPNQFPESQGVELVMVGRSNVGKSSLINQLAGFKTEAKARVSQRPGCTQSINFFNFRPGLVLVDFPGYGYAQLPVIQRKRMHQLVDAYFQAGRAVGLIVHLVDARLPLQAMDRHLIEWVQNFHYPYLLTLNKCDKLSRSILGKQQQLYERELKLIGIQHQLLAISAKTGTGIPTLKKMIHDLLANSRPAHA